MGAVIDRDNGYQALVKRLYGLSSQRPSVAVGILEGPGAKEYSGGGKHPMTVLEAATINAFGTEDGHIPPRPFISAWFDANVDRLHSDFGKLMASVVAGNRTADQILELMGQRCVGEIQAFIAQHGNGAYAENAASTIRRKGSSTPLIDTGVMRASISYEIRRGGGST